MDGKTQRIGADRSLVLDLLRWSSSVPSFPVERRFDLREVEAAAGKPASGFHGPRCSPATAWHRASILNCDKSTSAGHGREFTRAANV